MNDLVTVNQIPGFFNYTKPGKIKEQFQLVQIDESEEAAFAPLIQVSTPNKQGLSYSRNSKSDLPLTSDFGEINSSYHPYQLVYARLEGLQNPNRA